jgi:hypothetical protein
LLTLSEETIREVPAMSESSTTLAANVGSVATCRRYDAAPVTGLQVKVIGVERLVASVGGATSPAGAMTVLKLETGDGALFPRAFEEVTLQ